LLVLKGLLLLVLVLQLMHRQRDRHKPVPMPVSMSRRWMIMLVLVLVHMRVRMRQGIACDRWRRHHGHHWSRRRGERVTVGVWVRVRVDGGCSSRVHRWG
jgi:hypothetical protein